MPNKEDKKHFLKRKCDSSSMKAEKCRSQLLSDSVSDLPEVCSNHHFSDGNNRHTMRTNFLSLPKDNRIFSCSSSEEQSTPFLGQIPVANDRIHEMEGNSRDLIKRRQSKSQGAKFFFFPFLKKSSDIPAPDRNTKLIGKIQNCDNSSTVSPNQCSISTYDSSEGSNASFNSASSLFSASQYVYSTCSSTFDTTCMDCSTSFGKIRRNSCNSPSFLVQKVQNKLSICNDMRPNSIAFPLAPPTQSTINLSTCDDCSIRHSIAVMPHHSKESSQGSLGKGFISGLQSAHYIDKCISYPSLENHQIWNAVNPSHPDYPQVARNIMCCSKSQFISKSHSDYNRDLKRQSLPSDADSGVAFDHHKRSMVFSGYNGLLSLESSNHNLSISSTSDFEPFQVDDTSSRSSYECEPATIMSRDSPVKLGSKYHNSRQHLLIGDESLPDDSLFSHAATHIQATRPRVSDTCMPNNLGGIYFCPNENCKDCVSQHGDLDHFNALYECSTTAIHEISPGNFQYSSPHVTNVDETISPRHSQFLVSPFLINIPNNFENYRFYTKPRSARSIKNRSDPDQYSRILPYIGSDSQIHGRDISFYTYIAPDPNHYKEIPKWLEDYSKEESLLQFSWKDSKVDDLICWITLLGRLYKKELEAIIKEYEYCRDNLISIIDERSEELIEERIALENALISDETYV